MYEQQTQVATNRPTYLVVSASAEAVPLKAACGNNIFIPFDDILHWL